MTSIEKLLRYRAAPTVSLETPMRVENPFTLSTFIALRDGAPQTLTQISRAAGMSRPTALAAVNELDALGWIERLDPSNGDKAGRPAMQFRFRGEHGVVAGIDLGVHKILVLLQSIDGALVGEHRVLLEESATGRTRIDAVASAVTEAMAMHAPSARLLAAGIGVPGIVDRFGRISVSRAIPQLDGVDLGSILSAQLGCAIFVENDAHSATLGEFTYGAGRGTRDLIYLVAGYRTSAGIIIDQKLHRGRTGVSGMVGEMSVLPWRDSVDGLVHHNPDSAEGPATIASVFEAAQGGDPGAQRAVAKYVDDLAVGLAMLALAIDPELVVVGGGVSQAGAALARELRERLSYHARLVNPRVELSELGDRATALGGVRLALDHVETAVFDLSALPDAR